MVSLVLHPLAVAWSTGWITVRPFRDAVCRLSPDHCTPLDRLDSLDVQSPNRSRKHVLQAQLGPGRALVTLSRSRPSPETYQESCRLVVNHSTLELVVHMYIL